MTYAPTGDACPACGGRQTSPLFRGSDRLYGTTAKEFTVVECSACQLLRLHPWPSPEELKEYYPETYWFKGTESTASQGEEIYRRLVLRDHVNFVQSALDTAAPGPVLDVGCGGGLLPRLLRRRGAKVFGMDYSPKAASVAWTSNGVPAASGDLSNAPFAPESFAALSMFHVLEHLYDPAAYLQAAHKLLRPDGKLIVQVPNAASWQFLLFGERWNGLDIPRHLINFREKDLSSLIEGCGFRVLRRKFFSLRDNPAGLATTCFPKLDPMARRVRQTREAESKRLAKDALYLLAVLAALPFTLLEAACHAGSSVMIEAQKR